MSQAKDFINGEGDAWFNRNVEDWLTNWQVFLQDQFSFSFLRIKSNLTKSSRDQEISEYYNKIIQAGHKPLIIDCGSNNGASSVYFNLSYPESKIISLEIDHNNFLHSLNSLLNLGSLVCPSILKRSLLILNLEEFKSTLSIFFSSAIGWA